VPADEDGYLQALGLAMNDASSSPDDVPLILGHDLNASQAQALVNTLERVGKEVRLVLVALCVLGAPDADDAATLDLYYLRQRGTRLVQRADDARSLERLSTRAGSALAS
ncbi:MAG: hypothetical protein ACKPKO_59550, partial [Candidatus Fonsibacter sp.]